MQKKIFEETIAENLLNFVKDTELQIQEEAQGTPNRAEKPTEKSMPRHIIIELLKNKDKKNIKSSQSKNDTFLTRSNVSVHCGSLLKNHEGRRK